MTNKKIDLIVKSNKLVEASYKLDLIEQRIVLAAIVEARECGVRLVDGHITISATRFATMYGITRGSLYEDLQAAVKSLYQRSVVFHDESIDGKQTVTQARWVSSISYSEGAGAIRLRFAPEMIPFITRLESEFTSYRLEKIGNMSSVYAVRLYELLVQYLSIGIREVQVSWLKETFNISENYKAIKDFKKYVIDVAVDQVNEHSDIQVTYTQGKTGRTVTHLIFTIKSKEPPTPKTTKKPKPIVITREVVEKYARPGETYEAAEKRLKENPPAA